MTSVISGDFWQDMILLTSVVLGLIYLLSGLDDFLVDLCAFIFRCGPEQLTVEDEKKLSALSEKRLAILIPAWDESEVIGRMIRGNLRRLQYSNYHIFVGTYPNDPATTRAVSSLNAYFDFVHAVVNPLPGPTSKGQMVNALINAVYDFEKKEGIEFDGFVLQDAEDVLHPKSLLLMNERLEYFDFIQTPVFSLKVSPSACVAGTYMDEFAESHTKDLLVRERLGAGVPSAGVGTAISRSAVAQLSKANRGFFLRESALTEDYELGIRASRLGLRSHFACCQLVDSQSGELEFIATREYFPKKFFRSVRQKTRWTIGIALQGTSQLGWKGNLFQKYFLLRDRKGIVTNLAALFGYVFFGFVLILVSLGATSLEKYYRTPLKYLFVANLALMIQRLLQRTHCVLQVYGIVAALPILFRWPVAISINAFAVTRALTQALIRWVEGGAFKWVKTEHELPELFGQVSGQAEAV